MALIAARLNAGRISLVVTLVPLSPHEISVYHLSRDSSALRKYNEQGISQLNECVLCAIRVAVGHPVK